MNVLFGLVVIFGFMYLFIRIVIGVRRRQITPAYGTDTKHTTYFISFKSSDKPDIRHNDALNQVVKVKFETEDGYSVASSLNDRRLRDLIMKEFDLKPSQVIVTYRQFV